MNEPTLSSSITRNSAWGRTCMLPLLLCHKIFGLDIYPFHGIGYLTTVMVIQPVYAALCQESRPHKLYAAKGRTWASPRDIIAIIDVKAREVFETAQDERTAMSRDSGGPGGGIIE